MRIDITISYCIRFCFACQAIVEIQLFYLIFGLYYFLFASPHSYLCDNCVLIISISSRKVKRCRAFIPWLKPWAFPRGFRKIHSLERYKNTKDTRIRICGRYGRYEDGRYRPFPLFSPPSRVEERGEFDSGVFDRHLWSLCVSCNSSGCMCREVVYLIHQEIR